MNRSTKSKKPRGRPDLGRTASNGSVKFLQIPANDDIAITSGDESNYPDSLVGDPNTPSRIQQSRQKELEASPTKRPPWVVRHRIYLDNILLSSTLSAQRAGIHKFPDFLLREQIETRLYAAHNGLDAHFATRHATLRFWRRDGSLAEKWMDKDWDGAREHEFAMENLNDWMILQLAMGSEEKILESPEGEETVKEEANLDDSRDETMDGTSSDVVVVEDVDTKEEETKGDSDNDSETYPTMDITSHYLTSYYDARNISSAPEHSASSTHSNDGNGEGDADEEEEAPRYHWVEERRRDLEHQLRSYYHCTSPACFNKGGTCIEWGHQHLHVGVKDLTDWSQQIAHANRSIAATTLHLAAKLIDDQTRAQDERLADVGREREDEDDLGLMINVHPILQGMRPNKGDGADLDPLD